MPGTGIVLLDHIRISECPKQPGKSTTRRWYARSALGALARPGDGAAKLIYAAGQTQCMQPGSFPFVIGTTGQLRKKREAGR